MATSLDMMMKGGQSCINAQSFKPIENHELTAGACARFVCTRGKMHGGLSHGKGMRIGMGRSMGSGRRGLGWPQAWAWVGRFKQSRMHNCDDEQN
jgi:hypothetical protein